MASPSDIQETLFSNNGNIDIIVKNTNLTIKSVILQNGTNQLIVASNSDLFLDNVTMKNVQSWNDYGNGI